VKRHDPASASGVSTSPDFPSERLIVCRNRELARLAAAVARQSQPLRGVAVIGLKVGAVLDRHKMAKHFILDIADNRFDFARKTEAIAAEAALDGIYVRVTEFRDDGRIGRRWVVGATARVITSQAPAAAFIHMRVPEATWRCRRSSRRRSRSARPGRISIAKPGDPRRRRSTKCPSRVTGQARFLLQASPKVPTPRRGVKELVPRVFFGSSVRSMGPSVGRVAGQKGTEGIRQGGQVLF